MPETVKEGPLRFFNNHSVAKYQTNEVGLFGVFKKFSRKQKMRNFNGSLIVTKNLKKRDPLGFSNIRSVARYQTKRRVDPLSSLKIFEKK